MFLFFAEQRGIDRRDYLAHDARVGHAAVGMESDDLLIDAPGRRYVSEHPVKLSAPRQILDIGEYLASLIQSIPEIFEHRPRHVRVPNDAVWLAEQLGFGIPGTFADH